MTTKKSNLIKTVLFLLVFTFITSYLISDFGFVQGIHSALLTWSFYVLCVPLSGNNTIAATLLYFFTKKTIRYAGILTWILAILLNIFSYYFTPASYTYMATTILLYRIIGLPWPNWCIIMAATAANLYNLAIESHLFHRFLFFHKLARLLIAFLAALIFLYLAYIEIIILLSVKTH